MAENNFAILSSSGYEFTINLDEIIYIKAKKSGKAIAEGSNKNVYVVIYFKHGEYITEHLTYSNYITLMKKINSMRCININSKIANITSYETKNDFLETLKE